MRATTRMTGFAKKTVERLLVRAGEACANFQHRTLRTLKCKRLQVDEVWSFTHCKQANIPDRLKGERHVGDTWTWVGLCPDSKLVVGWHVGKRTANDAFGFIHDLKERLGGRVQMTSDGLRCYIEAVESAFGSEIDYGQLIKLYGNETPQMETRYSPPPCIGTRKTRIAGNPDPAYI